MVNVLFVNPGKWGRGITPIWIASHCAVLKNKGFNVDLFDATFYKSWAENENDYNTKNNQYSPSDYGNYIKFSSKDIKSCLQEKLNVFKPDYIFFSALSSHIHGEGEYISIQLGCELINNLKHNAKIICGGLQPTANPLLASQKFSIIDFLISGETEFVLPELIQSIVAGNNGSNVAGVSFVKGSGVIKKLEKQEIISDMDKIGLYDYSLFDEQIFYRPYNGNVLKAIDYEISRGCPFTCSYCVETVIQKYYNFVDTSPRGSLLEAKKYLRNKSAQHIFEEIKLIHKEFDVTLFRLQDTNFLTVNRQVLRELAELISKSSLDIMFYIETRPEGINKKSIDLLVDLKVDGVGMGIELATQSFREEKLNRFSNQEAIENAFDLLRQSNIKRTAYNIIGLPDQDEDSILETIKFNKKIEPDNITVAFYSPYIGTGQQKTAVSNDYFLDYEFDVDSQLRTMSKHDKLSKEKLKFYKENFVKLVRQ
jgi:anaerobic magnesium-protoporphyrin IX monomethyl ester cyclase